MTLARLNDVSHLTFDCYGTLIDWERGILDAMQPLVARGASQVSAEAILRSYVQHEARLESQPWRPYRDILREAMRGLAADFAIPLAGNEADALVDSLPNWPPFPDTVTALQKLSRRFRLVILSNTDDALFAETRKRLRANFAEVITAEQVRSYKPGLAHFHEALRRLQLPTDRVIHVAQSLYHDHVPAQRLGFKTAWVNRPTLLAGTGLAPRASVQPDIEIHDLARLVSRLTSAQG